MAGWLTVERTGGRRRRRARRAIGNPWVDVGEDADAADAEAEADLAVVADVGAHRRLGPQLGVEPPPRRLEQRVVEDVRALWWLGAHGGAGETTLAGLMGGSRDAGHAWPIGDSDTDRARVVLVARTSAGGLMAAQAAATEWASGSVAVELLGLALVADAPGRVPRGLRELSELVAGGVPRLWLVPWVERWRQGEPATRERAPRAIRSFLDDLERTFSIGSGAIDEQEVL